jgi:hypothetical protein
VTFQGFATEGWMTWFGAVKYVPEDADGFTGLSITTVSNLVGDGCRDHTALDPPVGPTVDDLAIALSQLAPFEVTAPPTDVTLFGYQGKHVELTVPALTVKGAGEASVSRNIAKFTDCADGELHSWISPINDRSSSLLAWSSARKAPGVFNAYQVPGQTEEFWILDVEGTRLVLVSFDSPQSPAADVAERDAVFDSIRIEPPPETAGDFPNLTNTFVSPRNGFSIKHPDRVVLTPAKQLLGRSKRVNDGFDVVETGLAAVLKGASAEIDFETLTDADSTDGWVDEFLSDDLVLPGGCGVPRSRQAEITIDGHSGRISECPSRIEATVVAGGRLYLFTLEHDRSDARAVFDAFAATIDLTPETAVDFPALTSTFVSPINGYSFKYLDRGGLERAMEIWDPIEGSIEDPGPRQFDAVETGYGAYFMSASTEIPEGVSIDEWVDAAVAKYRPSDCDMPPSPQEEISIDGHPARISECPNRIEATAIVGGRLYLFTLDHRRTDARALFDVWIDTIDLTPETAAVS